MRKKIDEEEASTKTIADYLTLRDSLSKMYMSAESNSPLQGKNLRYDSPDGVNEGQTQQEEEDARSSRESMKHEEIRRERQRLHIEEQIRHNLTTEQC